MAHRVFRAFGVRVASIGVASVMLGTFVSAGDPQVGAALKTVRSLPGSGAGTATAATSSGGAPSTSILGAAWRADNAPVPRALLRLRNIITGRIEATTVANDMGQFAFTGVQSGTYAVEVVTEAGKIVSLGHSFTVAPGETVATFVRLTPKVPWFNAIFGNSSSTTAATGEQAATAAQETILGTQPGVLTNVASAASSSAASTGVTAVAPDVVRPASGRH